MTNVISYGGKVLGFGNIAPKDGIAYQRPLLTNLNTSYRTGDDAWNLANGTYNYTLPAYPIFAELDITQTGTNKFLYLKENNAFGNKYRFTDDVGTQVYAIAYIIDHLTGLGWDRTYYTPSPYGWNQAIDDGVNSTRHGFTDWRIPNVNEMHSIINYGVGFECLNYLPFSAIKHTSVNYCSTSAGASPSTYFLAQNPVHGLIGRYIKTTTGKYYICRNHYT